MKFKNLKKCTRDGSTLYKGSINYVNKDIIQISDRFHLIKNCIDAIKDDLKKLADKHIVLGEKYDLSWIKTNLSLEQQSIIVKRNKKQELINNVREDYLNNYMTKTEIIKKYGLDLKTINRYLNNDATIARRHNITALHKYAKEVYEKLIEYKLNNTEINYRAIHTYLCTLGYKGSYENFYKQLKLRILENDLQSSTTITRKEFNKLLYGKPLTKLNINAETKIKLIDYLNTSNPFSRALNIIETFREIISNRSTQSLDEYIKIFKDSNWDDWIKVREFMNGVERDLTAINNQINETITNSTTEGFVSKIKTIKKRTYGRASFAHIKSLILIS